MKEFNINKPLQPGNGTVLITGFGKRYHIETGKEIMHYGIDLVGGGETVVTMLPGVVEYVGNLGTGLGTFIVINHGYYKGAPLLTRYGHLKETTVEIGDTVTNGERIGLVGQSGQALLPHLHFEVWENETPVDPLKYVQY